MSSALTELRAHCRAFAIHLGELAQQTIDASSPCVAPLDPAHSLVSPLPARATPDAEVFVVDCGGTNLKIAKRLTTRDSTVIWDQISLVANDDIAPARSAQGSDPMKVFARSVIDILQRHSEDTAHHGVAIIWSNGATARELPDSKGITALVSGKDAGLAYNKGEWYLQQLRDGDDVGRYFLDAAANSAYRIDTLFVGNDTVCTACSGLDEVDAAPTIAGMIASTGANCTLLGEDFINPEIGGRAQLPHSLLTEAEIAAFGSLSLEQPMAGKWLPEIFLVNLRSLANTLESVQGNQLESFVRSIEASNEALTNKRLNELSQDPLTFAATLGVSLLPEVSARVQTLTDFLQIRAGMLGGAMALAGVARQLTDGSWLQRQARRLMLDSTMAYFPSFLPTMQNFIQDLITDRTLEIVRPPPMLLKNGERITLPSRGAAIIIDQLLQRSAKATGKQIPD